MIVRKFTNYRNQVYLKSEGVQQPQPPLMASTLKKSNPLLQLHYGKAWSDFAEHAIPRKHLL
jgi:hypothetical protein